MRLSLAIQGNCQTPTCNVTSVAQAHAIKRVCATRALQSTQTSHPTIIAMLVIYDHTATSRPLLSSSTQHSEDIWGCDFNMVAELLPIAPPNTTTSGFPTTTAAVKAGAAAATATIFMIIWLSAAAYIIIRYIILPHRYRADMAMARCQPLIQNNNLELLPFCLICNNNDCASDATSAGSPSSTSASVATDDCDLVDHVAFYINMMLIPTQGCLCQHHSTATPHPFLEWTSEVRGFLQLNDFGFLINLDTAFNEVNPVSLNDIYTARDDTEAIDRGIIQHNEGLAALSEGLAQRDQPVPDGQPAQRAAVAINGDITNVTGQRDALITTRDNIKRDINRASQYLTYILVHATKPNSEVNNHVRQLQRNENGFEIWRQKRQRFSGGQRAQQLQLLQCIMIHESKMDRSPTRATIQPVAHRHQPL